MDPIWSDGVSLPSFPALSRGLTVDAAVIGGGMTGLLCACALQKSGLRTVVLEAGRIAHGQTCGTTAKITSQHGLNLSRLCDNLGEEAMRAYAAANEAAIDAYERLIREEEIDCGFKRLPAALYTAKDPEILRREERLARSCGIGAHFEAACGLPFPVSGVLFYEDQACFHPLRFLAALSRRLTIYENTRVLRAEGGDIETENAHVRAEHVVFACHFPFVNVPGLYFARMHQSRSYVLALENAQDPGAMYYGIDPDGYSLRPAGKYLLFGGESHRTGENEKGGQYASLRAAAARLFPGARAVRGWSAQDCMTPDGIPYIGRFAASAPRWSVATGFGKWGMTHAMAAAGVIRDLVTGRENPYAALYDPARFTLSASAHAVAMDTLHAAKGLAKTVFRVPRETAETLRPGQGGVTRRDGGKAGVYRDEGGALHAVRARCPHLGCELAWNPEEKSWDCPCHGSRFDRRGNLLNGPAQEDIGIT